MRFLHQRSFGLAGNEIAVADGEAAPESSLHVIRAELFQFIFDAPWHNMLFARQEIHAPNGIVGKVFLDVGKAVTVLPFARNSPFDNFAYRKIAAPWHRAHTIFPAS